MSNHGSQSEEEDNGESYVPDANFYGNLPEVGEEQPPTDEGPTGPRRRVAPVSQGPTSQHATGAASWDMVADAHAADARAADTHVAETHVAGGSGHYWDQDRGGGNDGGQNHRNGTSRGGSLIGPGSTGFRGSSSSNYSKKGNNSDSGNRGQKFEHRSPPQFSFAPKGNQKVKKAYYKAKAAEEDAKKKAKDEENLEAWEIEKAEKKKDERDKKDGRDKDGNDKGGGHFQDGEQGSQEV